MGVCFWFSLGETMARCKAARHIRKLVKPFAGLFCFSVLLFLYVTGNDSNVQTPNSTRVQLSKTTTTKAKIAIPDPVQNDSETTTTQEPTMPPKMFSADVRDKLTKQKVVKLVLLSVNPRSGSTFLSELLSSPPMTSFWQEPLRFLYEHPPERRTPPPPPQPTKKRFHKWRKIEDDENLEPPKDTRYRKFVPEREKVQMISDFLNCKFMNYTELVASDVSRQFIFKLPEYALGKRKGRISTMILARVLWKKILRECKSTKLRIIKTIRLTLKELLEDLKKGKNSVIGPDYKVLVLYRDPRAIMTSLQLSPDHWIEEFLEPEYVCKRMITNYNAFQDLADSDRIKMLRYEDFMSNKVDTLRDVYDFLGLSYISAFPLFALSRHIRRFKESRWDNLLKDANKGPKVFQKLKEALHSDELDSISNDNYLKPPKKRRLKFIKMKKFNTLLDGGKFRYYSTNRSPDFDHDHWKKEISIEYLNRIQFKSKKCRQAMELLGYKPVNDTILLDETK